MNMAHLQISELIPASRMAVFDFLTDPARQKDLLGGAIEVKLVTPDVPVKRGNEVHFMMARFGFSQSVRFRVEDVLRGSRLSYRQTEGVFAQWTHTMKFEEHGENATLVTDLVDYQLPLGLFGYLADDLVVKGDMSRLLAARLERAKDHFAAENKA